MTVRIVVRGLWKGAALTRSDAIFLAFVGALKIVDIHVVSDDNNPYEYHSRAAQVVVGVLVLSLWRWIRILSVDLGYIYSTIAGYTRLHTK